MTPESAGNPDEKYAFGPFLLDATLGEIYRHRAGSREYVHLRPQAFGVLLYLIHNRDRDVSKEELWEAMPKRAEFYDVNHVDRALLDVRNALGDSVAAAMYVRKKGPGLVRFIAEVNPPGGHEEVSLQESARPTISNEITATASFEIVPQSEQLPVASTADRFYDGFPPTWAELKAQFDIERHIWNGRSELRGTLATLIQTTGVSMFVLTGVAGCGKTTVLHRLGFDIANSGTTVLRLACDWHVGHASSLATQLKTAADSTNGPLLVLLDNVGDLVFEHPVLDSTIHELQHTCRNHRLVIACAEETNRWRAARRKLPSLSEVLEYTILHLLQNECEELVDTILRLEQKKQLTIITPLSREQRLQLCENPARRQFLVAMLQMRHGEHFRAIIHREFERIPLAQAQRAYGLICQLNALNLFPPKQATLAAVGVESGLQLTHFHDNTVGLLLDEQGEYRARHVVIAREVAHHAFATPEARRLAIVEILRALNPKDEGERKWLKTFFTKPNIYDVLCSLFDREKEVVGRFYEDARSILHERAWSPQYLVYVATAEGMSQRSLRDYDHARKCFIEAEEVDPSYEWVVRQHAWLEQEQGKWEDAARLAECAVRLAPDNFESVFQCALILGKSTVGNFRRAKKYYKRALELEPTHPQLEREWRRYCEAEHDLIVRHSVLSDSRIIPEEIQERVRPGLAFFRVLFGTQDKRFKDRLKGHLNAMAGSIEGALEDLHHIASGVNLEKNPSLNALYQLNVGRLMYLEWYHKDVEHSTEAMERAFDISLKIDPSNAFGHCWYGTFLKEVRKDIEGARREYQAAQDIARRSKNKWIKDHPLFPNNMALLLMDEVDANRLPHAALFEAKDLLIEAVAHITEDFPWPPRSLVKCEALMRERGMLSE